MFGKPCGVCGRSHYWNGSEERQLETCYSQRHGRMACMRCHFGAPIDTTKPIEKWEPEYSDSGDC